MKTYIEGTQMSTQAEAIEMSTMEKPGTLSLNCPAPDNFMIIKG